jgi:bacteriorhodopsin
LSLKLILIAIAIAIPFFMLTMWAAVDVAVKKFPTPREKTIWWVIALIPFIGWLIYLAVGCGRGVKPGEA